MELEEEEHEEEEEEEDDYDDDDDGITIPPPPTQPQTETHESGALPNICPINHRKAAVVGPATRYRECLKNHAVNIGGHAVDGCGEFMPAGEENTINALKCAACGCHRNFHRKETSTASSDYFNSNPPPPPPQPQPLYTQFAHYRTPPPFPAPPPLHHYRPLALPSTSGGYGGGTSSQEMDELSNPSSSGGGGGGGSLGSGKSKRFRTKFTQEQKDRMLEFAERVGWRIQKHDEAAVQLFCQEVGVRRQVLKVWMHNNKNTLGGGRKPPPPPAVS